MHSCEMFAQVILVKLNLLHGILDDFFQMNELKMIKYVGQHNTLSFNKDLIAYQTLVCLTLKTAWSILNIMFYRYKNILMDGCKKEKKVASGFHSLLLNHWLSCEGHVFRTWLSQLSACRVSPMAVPMPEPINHIFKGCQDFSSIQRCFIKSLLSSLSGRVLAWRRTHCRWYKWKDFNEGFT